MSSRKGASQFSSLMQSTVLWWPGLETTEFPIIPSGVTVTPAGTFTKTDLGNNKSVVRFDGSTNYILLTDSTSWNIFESNFTIACNVKFTSVTANRIICGQYTDANNYWYLGWTTSNTLVLIGMVSGSATFSYSCALTPSTSTWYHITVQRSSSSCLMYIDGVSQSVTETTAFTGTTNIAAVLNIGLSNTTYMLGLIKDFMTFTRALTLPEIKLLMNRTHPITGAGLLPGGYDYYTGGV